jgi:amino acid adenylation domain-containing protein
MSELLETVELSVAEKRTQLMHSLQRHMGAALTSAPLSHGQAALWFLQQTLPDSAAYHVAFCVRVRSLLDVAALRRACQQLLNRHEALRTTYAMREGVPHQVIHAYQVVQFEQRAAAGWTREQLHEQVLAAYARPFDLERGSLWRTHLFSSAADDHVLLLTVHHIAFDAWSLWLLQEELSTAYAAERSGLALALPAVRHFYTDYVRWQHEMLAGERGQTLWSYWQGQLHGASTVLDLPMDRPRPAVQSQRGASFAFRLDCELSLQLKHLAREAAVTPFTLLLAAFQVLLFRYSGQEDILVGSPTAGRTQERFNGIVGYFVNPVVLRARLAGNPRFSDFLQQTHQTVLEALAHADYPFPLLVQRLQPTRDASLSPLFQVSFVLQKAQRGGEIAAWVPGDTQRRMRWGGLEVELHELAQQEGQFDLELEVLEAGQALHAIFKYSTDLFEPQRIAQLSQSWCTLLSSIVAEPTQSIGELPLLTVQERAHLLERGRVRSAASEPLACLQHRFEQQVRRNPRARAVTCEGRELSYGELNRRANQLAHHLQSLGVGPEVLVGILLERSLDMLVALLGVLKAGGAYLPLDPASPPDRLAFIVADSAAPVLVTQSSLIDKVPACATHTLCIDGDWLQSARANGDEDPRDANPVSNVGLDHLAYVIYTSGSTGKPKGAQVTHRNVARLFTSTADWFGFDAHDVWTLYHSFAFDFSVWEIWGALLYGGRVVVVPYLVARAPDEFLQLLVQEGVTVLNQTPSAFRVLMQAEARSPEPAALALRYIIFGGEQLDPQSLKPWFDRHGDHRPQLINMYGITETTVHVTYRPLTRHDLASPCSVIGAPIPDLEIHILDPHLQPLPLGVAGEMYVGGAGVARGYLNRAELTAQKFIEPALGTATPARLYRTGDLARQLTNGDIEYIGRIDNQVKVRGFRIELGEIETVLAQHAQVHEAVVRVQKQHAGDVRLVAYVVGTVEAAELRQHLLQKLPAYMVPAAFVHLPQLPLTNNGKIDYAALPSVVCSDGRREPVGARDDTEAQLVQVWQQVLNVAPVGIHDNFFELGGHSLLAVALMEHIERCFARRLPIATLFRQPTIEQLAVLLRGQQAAATWSPLVPIRATGALSPFFCVAGGGGNVLYFQALAQALGADQPFYGLQAAGLDGAVAPLTRIEDMAQANIAALRSVQAQGPYLLGGHCFGGVVAFEMAQQLQRAGQSVALVAIMDIPAPSGRSSAASLDDTAWLVRIAAGIEEVSGKQLALSYEVLATRNAEAQLQLLMERLQQVGFLPAQASLEHVRGLVEVSKANLHALAQFQPREVRPVPIALLRAAAEHPDYAYGSECVIRERDALGWECHAHGPVAIEVVPGNHLTMLIEPHVPVLAQRLAAQLRAAHTRRT